MTSSLEILVTQSPYYWVQLNFRDPELIESVVSLSYLYLLAWIQVLWTSNTILACFYSSQVKRILEPAEHCQQRYLACRPCNVSLIPRTHAKLEREMTTGCYLSHLTRRPSMYIYTHWCAHTVIGNLKRI